VWVDAGDPSFAQSHPWAGQAWDGKVGLETYWDVWQYLSRRYIEINPITTSDRID